MIKRLIAFVIDLVLLNLFGRVLSIGFGGWFFSLGQWGFAVGLAIFIAYFSIFESSSMTVASPGKRLVGIRVRKATGGPIGVYRAVARSLCVVVPWVIFNYTNVLDNIAILAIPIGNFLMGLLVLQLLFPLLNRGVCPQDILTRTYVIGGTSVGKTKSIFTRRDLVVSLGILVVTIGTAFISQARRNVSKIDCQSYDLGQLGLALPTNEKIYKHSFTCMSYPWFNRSRHPVLSASLLTTDASFVSRDLLSKTAHLLFLSGLKLNVPDELFIWCGYEFDIGIYRYSRTESEKFSAAEFNALIYP